MPIVTPDRLTDGDIARIVDALRPVIRNQIRSALTDLIPALVDQATRPAVADVVDEALTRLYLPSIPVQQTPRSPDNV